MRPALVALGMALLLLVDTGCSNKKITPGASFTLSILAKDKAGKLTPQGSIVQVGNARVDSRQEIGQDGRTYSLLVRKTQYGRATFEVTFPDKTTQMIQVKAGEPKDIPPKGEKIGLRIELQESH
jgi:hypothetical protein